MPVCHSIDENVMAHYLCDHYWCMLHKHPAVEYTELLLLPDEHNVFWLHLPCLKQLCWLELRLMSANHFQSIFKAAISMCNVPIVKTYLSSLYMSGNPH